MFPTFLPQEVNLLQQPDSIAMAQRIERHPISTTLSRQSIDTAYVRCGNQQPTILLLHGFDSSLLEFRRLLPLLAKSQTTWAVDLLGFGFTNRLDDLSYDPDSLKIHLYCFWRTLIKQPVILVGISMGGAAAIDFTLSYREAVSKLILINSVGFNGSYPVGQLLCFPFDAVAVEFWRQRRIQSLFWGSSLGLLDRNMADAIRCAMLPSLMPNWERAIGDFTRSGGYYRLPNVIPSIDKPTLILWGERDDVVGVEPAYQFKQAIAGSQLIWLAKAGHSPQWEQPEALAELILEFCRSQQ